jgi:hypothetical protein
MLVAYFSIVDCFVPQRRCGKQKGQLKAGLSYIWYKIIFLILSLLNAHPGTRRR